MFPRQSVARLVGPWSSPRRPPAVTRRRGVTALMSVSRAAPVAQLEADGIDAATTRVPPELWFPAAEGLRTVRGLAEHVTANLNDFKQPNPILRYPKVAEALLAAADAAGVRFHFTRANV